MVCYIKFCGKYRIFERTNDRETIKDISQSYKTISSISIYFFQFVHTLRWFKISISKPSLNIIQLF